VSHPVAFLLGAVWRLWTRLLKPAGRWVLADWRNGPLLLLAATVACHLLIIDPGLRAERDAAIAERDAIQRSLDDLATRLRAAQAKAAHDDAENKRRVEREQDRITEEIADDFEARLAEARARAARLAAAYDELRKQADRADRRGGAVANLPSLPAPGRGAAETAGEDRLPAGRAFALEDALIATEQAIQLDALIAWVERQAQVRVAAPRAED
jgi:hypothetical protein